MGGKSSDEPDYAGLAEQQGLLNEGATRDQTYANRPTQYTPWGYTSWQANPYTDPGSGEQVTRWEQTQGLTPELQELLNKQTAIEGGKADLAGGLVGRMQNEFGAPMDWAGLQPLQSTPQTQLTLPEGGIDDPYQTRQAAENAVYGQAMSRLQPQFQSRREATEIKLRNQGLSPGDQAYDAQMQALDQQETDATNQALWSANAAGRDESGQMFDQMRDRSQTMFGQALGSNQQNFSQNMQTANYQNQIRQQQLSEEMQKRGFSLNEINALLSGGQVGMPQMPNFSTAEQAQPAPVYQAGVDQASYDAAMNPWNAIMGTAGTLGGAYLGRPTGG